MLKQSSVASVRFYYAMSHGCFLMLFLMSWFCFITTPLRSSILHYNVLSLCVINSSGYYAYISMLLTLLYMSSVSHQLTTIFVLTTPFYFTCSCTRFGSSHTSWVEARSYLLLHVYKALAFPSLFLLLSC